MRIAITVAVLGLTAGLARGVDVQGVLPASMDQPRIYLAISPDAKSPPLSAKVEAGGLEQLLAGALGEKPKPGEKIESFAIEAFLDTGASGVMISKPTAEGLGIGPMVLPNAGGQVTFYDVGVGGEEPFGVTVPFDLKTCDYGGNIDGEAIARYAPAAGGKPVRLKIRGEGGLLDQITGGVDVAGMPVMLGKVMVVDARPLSEYEKLKTSLVAPGDPSIPAADVVVPLTYVDFARFTRVEPPTAPPATLVANPMIGPDPFNPADGKTPVVIAHGGKQAKLTMLLDTGATASFISIAKAREIGIDVDDAGKIKNLPANAQFTLPIGGIGGSKDVTGFYLDALTLPAVRGQPVRYVKAPVLVMDITVSDRATGKTFTLDGVFGMNYLVASASITTGGLLGADLGDINDGAFEQFTVDHVNRTMGLTLKK